MPSPNRPVEQTELTRCGESFLADNLSDRFISAVDEYQVIGATDGPMPTRTSPEKRERRPSRPTRAAEPASDRSRSSRDTSARTLQRSVGNQAMAEAIDGRLDPATAQITQPSDASEREARRVAEDVTSPEFGSLDSGSSRTNSHSVTDGLDASRRASATPRGLSLRGGRPLAPAARTDFESRFDRDFGDVRVHTGRRADAAARSIDAAAFTVGRDIAFRSGAYDTKSRSGRELLAHELTHVAQADRTGTVGGQVVARRGDGSGSSQGSGSGKDLEKRLDRIEQQYRDMIAEAREDGYDVAADNLERFLKGTGGTKFMDVSWLRSFDPVVSAEETNQERFEDDLTDLAYEMNSGETRRHYDYWDASLTGSRLTELYYASGTSTVTSTGNFVLEKQGDETTITGSVEHRWWDPYDWHPGLAAYVPGFGTISDADAALLQAHRGADSFDMVARWEQTVTGTVTEVDYWFDDESYEWSGP